MMTSTSPKAPTPAEVLLERELTNRAIVREGWGPTLRLKFLRSRWTVGASAVILAALIGFIERLVS